MSEGQRRERPRIEGLENVHVSFVPEQEMGRYMLAIAQAAIDYDAITSTSQRDLAPLREARNKLHDTIEAWRKRVSRDWPSESSSTGEDK